MRTIKTIVHCKILSVTLTWMFWHLLLAAYGGSLFRTSELPKNVHPKLSTALCHLIQIFLNVSYAQYFQNTFILVRKLLNPRGRAFDTRLADTNHWIKCVGFRTFRAKIKVFWKCWAYNTIRRLGLYHMKLLRVLDWRFLVVLMFSRVNLYRLSAKMRHWNLPLTMENCWKGNKYSSIQDI